MPGKPDVYTRVTDKIIADLERGALTGGPSQRRTDPRPVRVRHVPDPGDALMKGEFSP